MTDQSGLAAAVGALQSVREEWGLKTLIAFWGVPHGEVEVVVDADGHDVFINGEPVPRVP